jgi:hypothetical protein
MKSYSNNIVLFFWFVFFKQGGGAYEYKRQYYYQYWKDEIFILFHVQDNNVNSCAYVGYHLVSLKWRSHHYWRRAARFTPIFGAHAGPLSREGSLSCHTCYETGPWFVRSHPKNHPILSPPTTHKGMWRTHCNQDPQRTKKEI